MSRRNVSHRGAGVFGARHLTLGLALGLALSVTAIASPAGATPQSDLASKTEQAKQLEATIQANSQRADVLDEQYLQAQAAVADANRQIVSAEQGIASARAQVAGLRHRLGGRAARLYMGAGSGDPLGIDATNVQELGSRAKYGAAAAETDNKMIDQLGVLNEQLRRQETALEQQKADAQKRQDAAQAAHREVEKISSKMQSLLASTKSDIVSLARKIETDRIAAQAAAERARIQAQAAQQAAQATSGGGGGGVSNAPADIGINPGSIPAPSPGAAAAIAYARAQIGKPYRYAGTGPDAFDCSGLTMMAWAQGGVSMAHGSQSQWESFPKVPIADLQPGDLVFFGSSGPSNHHGGLYIGGGTMIEAPHTGAFVRYSSIYRPDLVSTGSRP
ncbi:MAG: peptidoglycan DL-endopeptidase CwlO [Actinomycetota bacterium]|nr:peptidoglycan DL-endopeptidase CwlO [Actinomycetota bacterium]